jgi:energy-converting hydrogenase Eha subunit A
MIWCSGLVTCSISLLIIAFVGAGIVGAIQGLLEVSEEIPLNLSVNLSDTFAIPSLALFNPCPIIPDFLIGLS